MAKDNSTVRCFQGVLIFGIVIIGYFILMFIAYGFEVASCITAATQRDFFTTNLFLKQMLERYQNNSPPNNDDKWKNNGVTKTWDRLMLQDNCCGINGPSDWQKYTSAFRIENNNADYPWPRQCCVMNNLKEPLNVEACKLGVPGYYHSQGCYELISGPMDRHAWGVAWFGFAILCWTLPPQVSASPVACFIKNTCSKSFGFSWVPCSTGAELNIEDDVSPRPSFPQGLWIWCWNQLCPDVPHLCSTVTRAFLTQMPSQMLRSSLRFSGSCSAHDQCFSS
ncbi:uroplakin-1b isoform X2 [Elephas maximus indicus]|uniref:uroplakin-1b isoform X2 n=1 Tax=Elephas maximus indicus TaxID=99487 RepID=UPI0021160EEE|nr:uroplakin-1b isoform X2 [Elephas maximus indicus]